MSLFVCLFVCLFVSLFVHVFVCEERAVRDGSGFVCFVCLLVLVAWMFGFMVVII